jgi:O-antigen ligase
MSRTLERPSSGAAIAVIAAAPALTVAAAYKPLIAVALLAALVFAAVALADLALGIALWLPLVFIGAIPGVAAAWHAGAAGLALVAFGTLMARHGPARAALRAHAPVLMLAAATVTWLTLSLAWAQRPGIARDVLLAWITSAVMFGVVLIAARHPRAVQLLLAAYVGGVVLSVSIGLVVGDLAPASSTTDTLVEEEGRLRGGIGDPNYLAASIVPALALAIGLTAGARSRLGRGAGLAVVALLVGGLVATESRGGFVALAVAAVVTILMLRRHRRRILVATAVLACVGGVLLSTTADDQGNGRVGLATVAARMIEDHPALGVGLGNFPVHSPSYVREPGSIEFVDLIAERGLPLHSTYLQLVVEAGPVALLLFALLSAVCLGAAFRAARRFEAAGMHELALLSAAVLVAGSSALSASIFLANGSDVQLWLLLAAGPVLDRLAPRTAIARRPAAAAEPRRPRRRAAAAPATRPAPAARA